MSVAQIRIQLEEILRFMHPYWELVNCHMVSYLTDNHWQRLIPSKLRTEVSDIEDIEKCVNTIFWDRTNETEFPMFRKFTLSCEQNSLDNCEEVLTSLQQLNKILGRKDDLQQKVSIKEFLSEKKKHEVELTAELVDRLVQNIPTEGINKSYIVDAGDGKGYLSSRLALQYNRNVLGIDSKQSNTQNALERNRKLQRVWKGLVHRAEKEDKNFLLPIEKDKNCSGCKSSEMDEIGCIANGCYKTASEFITPNLDIIQLLSTHFPTVNKFSTFCLTGLHTCGNLGSTCLKLFHEQPQCKILCNISCCYHLLQEIYTKPKYFENKSITNQELMDGFPMSQFLHEKNFKLGRNARMLATQSLDRTISSKNSMNISLFYRALLEVLISNSMPEIKDIAQVGKIRKFASFEEYVALCKKKLVIEEDVWTAQMISEVEEQYQIDRYYMHLFYLVRMSFAPVIESIILLDRLLYLKELDYENSYLVRVFDAVVSPRRFGIIAWKS